MLLIFCVSIEVFGLLPVLAVLAELAELAEFLELPALAALKLDVFTLLEEDSFILSITACKSVCVYSM